MDTQQTGFIVVVQRGLHAGASQALTPGRWLVGSAAHCDLVLRDAGVRAEHLVLNVSRDSVCYRHLPETGQFITWPAGQTLSIETLALQLQVQATLEPATGPVINELVNDTLSHRCYRDRKLPSRAQTAIRWLIGVAALGLAIVLNANQSNRASADGNRESPELTALRLVQQKLAGLGLDELRIQREADGALQVSGWVATSQQMRALRETVKLLNRELSARTDTSNQTISVRVNVGEELTRFAQEYLNAKGYTATIGYRAAGVIEVSAATSNEAAFNAAIQGLKQAAPDLTQVAVNHATILANAPVPQQIDPAPQLSLAGIDGVSLSGRRRFLSSGPHYVFEGGVLKDGSTVQIIAAGEVTVLPARTASVVAARGPMQETATHESATRESTSQGVVPGENH